MDSKRDQNFVTSLLCYNETTGLVEPARVDPATGALLIFITSETSSNPTSIENAKRDQNDVSSGLGYNESSGLTDCIRITNLNNLIIKSI